MSVFSGRGAQVDVMGISLEMRKAVRLWQTAYILVLDPGPDKINYREKRPAAFVWHGFARVQPYRREIAVSVPADPTTTQTVRFQLDFEEDGAIPLMRTGFEVIVVPLEMVAMNLVPDPELLSAEDLLLGLFELYPQLDGPPDPHIYDYTHTINASMNSSLAWVRTLETITNTERRNTLHIESNGAGGFQWIA